MLPPADPPVSLLWSTEVVLARGPSVFFFVCAADELLLSAEYPVSSSVSTLDWETLLEPTQQNKNSFSEVISIWTHHLCHRCTLRLHLPLQYWAHYDKDSHRLSFPQIFASNLLNQLSILSPTSHPAPMSCISHTRAPVVCSGWERCSHAAGWCPSPGHWSVAAGWRRYHCDPLVPGWAQSRLPGCTAASCSRHCTETHLG